MQRHALWILTLLFGLALLGCGGGGDNSPADTDTEVADGDSTPAVDGDTESEAAADGDSEADSVAEGDSESASEATEDGDSESAADGDSESTADGDSESVVDGDSDSASDDSDSQSDIDYVWTKFPVTVSDPVQSGTEVRTAIDNAAFAYDGTHKRLVSQFDWDIDDSDPYIWQTDALTGTETRITLTGTAFATSETFCNGENWCQFIGYDIPHDRIVIAGPRAGSIMYVSPENAASLAPVSGTQPPDSAISYTHTFAWTPRLLYVYGYSLPSGSGTSLYSLNLDTGVWTLIKSDLAPVTDNCLVYSEKDSKLYSFAGVTDGESDTTVPTGSYTQLDPATGAATVASLPTDLVNRRGMACTYNAASNVIMLFGGAEMHDNWNETLNVYHNDLWRFDPSDQSFTRVLPDLPGGTYDDPDDYGDQAFEGNPNGPNFGQNRGYMIFETDDNAMILLGEIPTTNGPQYFKLPVSQLPDVTGR